MEVKIFIFILFTTLFYPTDCQTVELFDLDVVKYVCPKGCNCYLLEDFIGCTNQNLSKLPTPIYNQVQILDLSYNNFGELPLGLIKLKQLAELYLSNNNIFQVTNKGLQMNNLRILDLSSNQFTSWSKMVATGENINLPPSITELRLSSNQIGLIETYPMLISSSLRELRLDDCSLTNISSGFLRNLTGLENLNVYKNKLRFISFSSESLQSLNISNNFIWFLPRDVFQKFPNLKTLDVSHNRLLNLHLPVSKTLEFLDMSFCNVEQINLTVLSNLKELNLIGNYIGLLTQYYFTNLKLQQLDLSRNSIESIDSKSFGKLKNLINLNMSLNMIASIHPDTFLNNINLNQLDLSRNYLSVLEFRVASLKYLDVSNCEIQLIETKGLTMLPSLERLYLSRNLISKIPDKIILPHLEYLDLSSNRISSIKNTTFSSLNKLKTLNLRHNRFTAIFKTFYFPASLSLIYLEDNLWHCNCFSHTFKSFYDYLVRSSKVEDNYKLVCHSPENVSGHPWHLSCSYAWYADVGQTRYDKMWLYISILVSTVTVIACVVMTVRKMAEIKAMREQTERQRRAEEARERIRRLRIQHREEAQLNAPDPRELVRPPSYAEAILLPRIDSTSSNLNSNLSVEGTSTELKEQKNRTKPKNNKNKKRRRRMDDNVENVVEVEQPKPEGSDSVENGGPVERARVGTDESDTEVEGPSRPFTMKNDVIESNL